MDELDKLGVISSATKTVVEIGAGTGAFTSRVRQPAINSRHALETYWAGFSVA